MTTPAAHVKHAADILITTYHFADATLIHQLKLRVTETFPQALLRLQVTHLLGRDGGEHATVLQVALDIIFGHPLTNDPPTFERHLTQQLRLLGADAALNHVDVTAVAVDDLPTVTPRCTKPQD